MLQKMVQVLAIANTARRFLLGGQKANRQDRPFYLHSCCKLSSTRTRPHMLVYHLTLYHMYISMYAKLALRVHAHMPLHTHVCIQVSMHTLVTLDIPLPPLFKVSTFVCLTFETKGILRDLLCLRSRPKRNAWDRVWHSVLCITTVFLAQTQCPKRPHVCVTTFMYNLWCRNCADFYWVLYCKPVSGHFCIT